MKNYFDIGEYGSFTFVLRDKIYQYVNCKIMAERISFNRTTIDLVVKTIDGKFAALCLTAESPEYAKNGITKGYYTIDELTEKQAGELAAIDNAFSETRV